MTAANTSSATPLDSFTDTRTLEQKLTAAQEAWMPHSDPGHPNPLTGLVVELAERDSNFTEGTVPAVRVLTGDGVEWQVIGFHTILRSELLRAGPHIGDRLGLIYKGEGTARENQSAPHIYRAIVDRNPAGPQSPDPELKPLEPVPDEDIPF